MVKCLEDPVSRTFAALADPTRREILERLALRECSVGELAAPFSISLPAVSKHLGVLERAGLVHREKDGRVRRCRFDPQPLRAAADWVERYRVFWDAALDRLTEYLESAEGGRSESP